MEFSYYNKNNELLKLNIQVGMNWDDLNVQNDSINSIFSKVDDGDRKITDQNELMLLQKLLNKADGILNPDKKNQILENDELEEIVKQIEDEKIKLPGSKNTEDKRQTFVEASSYHQEYPNAYYIDMKNPQTRDKVIEQEINKIEKRLSAKFPKDKYNIEVQYNGKYYESFVYDKITKKLSQGINIIRSDGIELSFSDNYKGEILDDDNIDYSKNHQSASFGELTITDTNGKSHVIHYRLDELYDNDVLDCRRMIKSVGEFLADLPQETIDKLIEKNVTDISFTSDYDNPLLVDKDYYRKKMDTDGNVIDIQDGYADIISPKFTPQNREYNKETLIQRDDGYCINIVDTDNNSAELKITTPTGKEVTIEIEGVYYDNKGDKFHQWQIPKLVNTLKELPTQVLEDLSDEIGSIKFMNDNIGVNGEYPMGSNTIAYTADYKRDTPVLSFIHELGHAIDNQNGTMMSNNSDFQDKFNKFKALTEKFKISEYALMHPAEYFACRYADSMTDDKTEANHIAYLDEQILKFKNSDDKDEQECYRLYIELKNDVDNMVANIRHKSQQERKDDTIKNLVKETLKDEIEEFNKYGVYKAYFVGQSVELEVTDALNRSDDDFNDIIGTWTIYRDDKDTSFIGEHINTPKVIQELYGKLIEKVLKLREQLKQQQ